MTYNARENSVESGKPFFLYEFTTPSTVYRFTNQKEDVSFNSETFSSVSIKHTEIRSTEELSKNGTKILIPLGNTFSDLFLAWPIDFVTTITIFRGHISESEVEIYWKGRIQQSELKDTNIEFSCESVFTSMRRLGLRSRFQRACRHALYHKGCNLDKNDFLVVGEVTAVTGQTLTITEASLQSDGWYVGGMLEFADNSIKLIKGHIGDQIVITSPSRYLVDYLNEGGVIPFSANLYPGCDRTLATCRDKFNNLVNQGGFKYIPKKNPFAGSSIV